MARKSAGSNPLSLDEHAAAHVAELFAAFGDTSRVRIIFRLAKGECNVSSIAQAVGISESAVSHHMRGLRQMRLVSTRKSGREVFYRVDDPHILTLFWQGVRHMQEK
jgi:DNA-binding transcriptional ArsR family regulator